MGFIRTASVNAVRGLGWVVSPTHVNCVKHRHYIGAKGADRLSRKIAASFSGPSPNWATRIMQRPVYQQGLTHPLLLERNRLTPMPRPLGSAAARSHVGAAGERYWSKRMPPRNRADRSCDITPP